MTATAKAKIFRLGWSSHHESFSIQVGSAHLLEIVCHTSRRNSGGTSARTRHSDKS